MSFLRKKKKDLNKQLCLDIIDKLPVALSIQDNNHNILWCNREFCNISGKASDKIIGQKCYSILKLPDKCSICSSSDKNAEEKWSEVTVLNNMQLLVNSIPVKDLTKKNRKYVVVAFNITERNKTETELRISEENLRKAQKLAHIGSWIHDLKNDSIRWSDEIFNIFETSQSDFILSYDKFLNLIHPDDRDTVNQKYIDSLKSGSSYFAEHRILLDNGRIKTVQERSEIFYSDDGKAVASVGTVQDVTEIKEIEKENRKLHNQFYQIQKMETIGRIAGGFAHDFNNMLQIILANLEIILDSLDECDQCYENCKQIKCAAGKSADLTSKMLAFARRQPTEPELIDINTVIEDLMVLLGSLAGKRVKINWHPEGKSLYPVKIDPVQLEQIMTNLCINSSDAISGKGEINIATENVFVGKDDCREDLNLLPGYYVAVSVKDNGCGIEESILSEIFEPFYTTKEKTSKTGSGLGLSTVYGIVDQNNGFIRVLSKIGTGTEFRIYFPSAGQNETEKEAGFDIQYGNGEQILIADNDKDITDVAKKMLDKLGYQSYIYSSFYESGISDLNKMGLNAVLVDIELAETVYSEFFSNLKNHYPDVKIIYMSSSPVNSANIKNSINKDAAFLKKPFSVTELASAVREIL